MLRLGKRWLCQSKSPVPLIIIEFFINALKKEVRRWLPGSMALMPSRGDAWVELVSALCPSEGMFSPAVI